MHIATPLLTQCLFEGRLRGRGDNEYCTLTIGSLASSIYRKSTYPRPFTINLHFLDSSAHILSHYHAIYTTADIYLS